MGENISSEKDMIDQQKYNFFFSFFLFCFMPCRLSKSVTFQAVTKVDTLAMDEFKLNIDDIKIPEY